MIQSKAKLKGLAKGLYGLYGVTGYVGDLVSYTRLMALGIAGEVLLQRLICSLSSCRQLPVLAWGSCC